VSGCRGQERLGKIARTVPYVIRFIPGHPTQARDGRRALCRGAAFDLWCRSCQATSITSSLPLNEVTSLALQLSIDRCLGGDAHDLVAVAHKSACRHGNNENPPPSFTTAPSSTLLFGAKSIAQSFSKPRASRSCRCASERCRRRLRTGRSRALPALAHRLRSARFYRAGRSRHTPGISLSSLSKSRASLVHLTSLVRDAAGPPPLRHHQRA
jgi:hypothetical protein